MCGPNRVYDLWAVGRTVDDSPIADYDSPVATDAAAARSARSANASTAELMERLRSAERDVAQLSRALESQRLIGVAIGMLAHRFDCPPEHSWRLLVRLSQTANVKVREIARILVDASSGRSAAADAEILAILAAQLPHDGRELWDTSAADEPRRSAADDS